MEITENHRHYWQKNLRITGILLAIWFVVTFVVGYYARELSFTFFGWPFSFWMGVFVFGETQSPQRLAAFGLICLRRAATPENQ